VLGCLAAVGLAAAVVALWIVWGKVLNFR